MYIVSVSLIRQKMTDREVKVDKFMLGSLEKGGSKEKTRERERERERGEREREKERGEKRKKDREGKRE